LKRVSRLADLLPSPSSCLKTAGRRHRLLREFQLLIGDRDVARAHAEKAADAQHGSLDVPALVGQEIVDRADILVLVVVDVKADDFRRPPVALISCRRILGGERGTRKQQRAGDPGRDMFR
jgi:hypothetical protein